MRPHVSGTERVGFSKARRSCNPVVAALQARFLLSEPCGRRPLCTSFPRNMTHTFLSHKNPRTDLSCVSPATGYSPSMESPRNFQLVKKRLIVACQMTAFSLTLCSKVIVRHSLLRKLCSGIFYLRRVVLLRYCSRCVR